MIDKKCAYLSYPFSRTLNIPVIFITNAAETDRGSSVYFVHQNGTIRCSGSNEGERKATTFIRPYLVAYIALKKNGILFNQAAPGLSPFEGCARSYYELSQIMKKGYGHLGNVITEIISFKNLANPDFTPSSWQNSEKGGTDWAIARDEVLEAWINVASKNYDFKKEEHVVDSYEF